MTLIIAYICLGALIGLLVHILIDWKIIFSKPKK